NAPRGFPISVHELPVLFIQAPPRQGSSSHLQTTITFSPSNHNYFTRYQPGGCYTEGGVSIHRSRGSEGPHATRRRLQAWFALSRPPFHTVGVFPFILGTIIAWALHGVFHPGLFALGTLAVVSVMLATYYAGEYWDTHEDSLSVQSGKSRFAGGSQVLQQGLLPHHVVIRASVAACLLAAGLASLLQFVFLTGPLTVPFVMLGLLGGFFYSARPLRWVSRGFGEIWILFCYGWLPVAVGYYLQVGGVAPIINWTSIPIGITIFNVILINEFPDYPADHVAGKANLVVRMGRSRAAYIYALASAAGPFAVLFSLYRGVPVEVLYFYSPILLLSLVLAALALVGYWQEGRHLERLCAATLVVNLGTTLSYILAFAMVGSYG
ncbi:MAG TPA: prenyltransferase, partial [Methanomicrobiales archaeon]|nr:prenyltransferase [Methanomicrobiales archaeon]